MWPFRKRPPEPPLCLELEDGSMRWNVHPQAMRGPGLLAFHNVRGGRRWRVRQMTPDEIKEHGR